MGKKNTYKVYRTASLSGTVIHNIVKAPSKKFTYIKAKQKKGEQVFYLDRERNFVDASRADTFSSEEALKISSAMKKSRKDYDFFPFPITEPLNYRAQKIAEEKPKPVISKEKAESPKKKPKPSPSNKPSQDPAKHDDGSVSPPPKIFIGMIVSHKQFGEGTIIEIDETNTHIRVAFPCGEIQFGYPHGFQNGYLEVKV